MWNIMKLQKRKKNRNKYIKQKIMLAINVIINVGFIKERLTIKSQV